MTDKLQNVFIIFVLWLIYKEQNVSINFTETISFENSKQKEPIHIKYNTGMKIICHTNTGSHLLMTAAIFRHRNS